jgi:hypothetical protein
MQPVKVKSKVRIVSDYGFSPFGGLGLHFYIYENDKLIKHLFQKDRQ